MTQSNSADYDGTISILQYNLRRSREITDSVLNHPGSAKHHFLLLQEQYWSTYNQSSLLHQNSWTLIQPHGAGTSRTRAAVYVNNSKVQTGAYAAVPFPSTDVVALEIADKNGQVTLLINVYNDRKKDTISALNTFLDHQLAKRDRYSGVIIGGDFNLHHPLWNSIGYNVHDEQADELVEIMGRYGMELILPPGTVTFEGANGSRTAIDLVWGNATIQEQVIKCKIAKYDDHGSDHRPIRTILSNTPALAESTIPRPYNYDKTDWETLKQHVQQALEQKPLSSYKEATENTVNNLAADLVKVLSDAVKKSTPRKNTCRFSKMWWTDEITELKDGKNKVRNRFWRKSRRDRSETQWKEWKEKEKEFKRALRKSKRDTWRTFVSEADERTIWQVKRYLDGPPVASYIPTLNNGKAATNKEKAAAFKEIFFPPPPPADTNDMATTNFPPPVEETGIITEAQVRRAIDRLNAKKAPGPDEVSNRVLKNCAEIIVPYIKQLATISLQAGVFPQPFKQSITLVLRKPQKPDYTKPNAYRPIALENTLGKVLESIGAEIISCMAESYNLLPQTHYGGRPGKSTEDAMMVLTENIHEAWKESKIFSAIFLDVAGAFNNVHHGRLIHNLRSRRIPPIITNWIASFLTGRTTTVRFNGTDSEAVPTEAGVPQGSPLSPILYIFYNSGLLDLARGKELALGFIDDIAYGVAGKTVLANTMALEAVLARAEEWRKRHGAQFEPSKYVLVHFTRSRKTKTDGATVKINSLTIEPSNEAKYLGVTFDSQLKFVTHVNQAVKKGTKFASAITRIAATTWGASFQHLRRLFSSVVTTRTDYAAVIWHRPEDRGAAPSMGQISKLEKVQRMTMKAITGCFRTTSTAALEMETDLIPTDLRLKQKVLIAATRMLTAPPTSEIAKWTRKALLTPPNAPKKSNLQHLATKFKLKPLESIKPWLRHPSWKPPALITIDVDKEAAQRSHLTITQKYGRDSNASLWYTDGSETEKGIGAGVYELTSKKTICEPLGSNAVSTVEAAELEAINLALGCIATKVTTRANPVINRYFIFSDSQAAVRSIQHPTQRGAGQSIREKIIAHLDTIANASPSTSISIQWVPGHMGIKGNEKADEAAKAATAMQLACRKRPTLKSAAKLQIKRQIKEEWEVRWQRKLNTKNGGRKRHTRERAPDKGARLYGDTMSRKHIAWLARLRTGHCSLNKYLHRFNIVEDPKCECGNGHETVAHYLLVCERYKEERMELRRRAGAWGMRVESLLGDKKLVAHTVKYVEATKRFKF
jgi:ribonuclease HI